MWKRVYRFGERFKDLKIEDKHQRQIAKNKKREDGR